MGKTFESIACTDALDTATDMGPGCIDVTDIKGMIALYESPLDSATKEHQLRSIMTTKLKILELKENCSGFEAFVASFTETECLEGSNDNIEKIVFEDFLNACHRVLLNGNLESYDVEEAIEHVMRVLFAKGADTMLALKQQIFDDLSKNLMNDFVSKVMNVENKKNDFSTQEDVILGMILSNLIAQRDCFSNGSDCADGTTFVRTGEIPTPPMISAVK